MKLELENIIEKAKRNNTEDEYYNLGFLIEKAQDLINNHYSNGNNPQIDYILNKGDFEDFKTKIKSLKGIERKTVNNDFIYSMEILLSRFI